jgi:hypothetical protein
MTQRSGEKTIYGQVLAKHVDGVVFVVRWGASRFTLRGNPLVA